MYCFIYYFSPFVRQVLQNTGDEDCVIYIPNAHNSSVRYLLEMMHTGFCSQIKKSEVGNLKILLEILGCCPEMGFSINMMNENSKLVKLANLDGNEQITNSGKTMISKVYFISILNN